jgi:hypothetical protein
VRKPVRLVPEHHAVYDRGVGSFPAGLGSFPCLLGSLPALVCSQPDRQGDLGGLPAYGSKPSLRTCRDAWAFTSKPSCLSGLSPISHVVRGPLQSVASGRRFCICRRSSNLRTALLGFLISSDEPDTASNLLISTSTERPPASMNSTPERSSTTRSRPGCNSSEMRWRRSGALAMSSSPVMTSVSFGSTRGFSLRERPRGAVSAAGRRGLGLPLTGTSGRGTATTLGLRKSRTSPAGPMPWLWGAVTGGEGGTWGLGPAAPLKSAPGPSSPSLALPASGGAPADAAGPVPPATPPSARPVPADAAGPVPPATPPSARPVPATPPSALLPPTPP